MSRNNSSRKPQIILLVVLLVQSACRRKRIWFSELQGAHNAESEQVSRVYFDRYGNIYLLRNIYIQINDLLN